jgi:hypothetical protein
MDKRFFLALLLSLVAIAISQLLFPPSKRAPANELAADSSAVSSTASTTAKSAPSTLSASTSNADVASTAATPSVLASSLPGPKAETTLVSTPKALYRFSSIGAAPVSIAMRDYVNRSTSGGLVDLAPPGLPLLGYKLVTPNDTADLSQVPFALSRSKSSSGQDILSYDASVKNLAISIIYTISQETLAR